MIHHSYPETPLCSLPRDRAEGFVTRLYSPEQRFARAFHRYWRDVMGQTPEAAEASTRAELAQSIRDRLDALDDPYMHTIGDLVEGEYQPVAMFGLRPLEDHAYGARIDALVRASDYLARRYQGRRALAHAVAIDDEHASLGVLRSIFLSIADKALAAGMAHVFFYSSDHRLARIYRRFGMEFSPDLCPPESQHLVGVYRVMVPENRRRVAQLAARMGRNGAALEGAA